MSFTERKALYFQNTGKENTEVLLNFVKEYAEKEGLRNIVVASTTGETGAKASKVFKGYNVVVVTHCFGFRRLGENELKESYKREILENGAKLFTGTHVLSSVERALRENFNAIGPLELIANTLRLMGEGTKVCVEITLMAADAGLIPIDRDIIAIAGTGRGADTALRMQPANTQRFFDLKIKEVIAKPLTF
ncbi:MAG: pyruvate kinase alpha/beta domain-containing protein [Candidatus Bathyarchaeales archaeon]